MLSAQADPAAFVHVYDAYGERLLVYLTRRLFDAQVAFELHQEVFALAFEKRARFRGQTSAEEQGWLYAIARNQLNDYFKHGAIHREAMGRLQMMHVELDDCGIERVERLADLAAMRPRIADALHRLSDDHRRAVEMRILDEMDYDEIASALAISEDLARARVSRGLKSMNRFLAAVGVSVS